MKIATVVGTRPEIIRLSRVLSLLDRRVQHVLVHTGQNYDYELNQIFFDDLGLRPPDRYLGAAGKTPAETIGQVIIAVDAAFEDIRPDAVLILGDTNSALAAIRQSGAGFRSSTWRRETGRSTRECPRRSTGESSTTSPT